MPVAQRGIRREGLRRPLFHRNRLPRHGALVGLEAAALQNPGVGGNLIPGLQQDNIPGHQGGGGRLPGRPVPQDSGLGRGHPSQLLQRLLGMVLLGDGDDPVDHHNHQDNHTVQPVLPAAGQQRQGGRGQQHQNHGILQLAQDAQEKPRRLGLSQLVGTVLLQPPGSLPGGEPLRASLHFLHHLRHAPAVPVAHAPISPFQFLPV